MSSTNTPNQPASKPEQPNQKPLAVFFVAILFLMYIQMVWIPYFGQDYKTAEQDINEKAAQNSEQEEKSANIIATNQIQPVTTSVQTGVETSSASPGEVALASKDEGAFPADASIDKYGYFVVETDTMVVTVSNLGGRITGLRLKDYPATLEPKSPGLDIITHAEQLPYPLGVYSGSVNDSRVVYQLKSSINETSREGNKSKFSLLNKDEAAFELLGTLPDGRTITKKLVFYRDNYLSDLYVTLSAPAANATRLEVAWSEFFPQDKLESSLRDPYNITSFAYFDGTRVERTALTELEPDDNNLAAPVVVQFGSAKWLSVGDKYFFASLLSVNDLTQARGIRTADLYQMRLSGGDVSARFRLFTGPKVYENLEEVADEFQLNIDFGKLGILSAPLLTLLHLFYSIFGNYALAIVMVTILMKAATYPLNAASFRSMKAMQELAPEIKRIQQSVTNKAEQQQQMMALYKKRGVNPMGVCQ